MRCYVRVEKPGAIALTLRTIPALWAQFLIILLPVALTVSGAFASVFFYGRYRELATVQTGRLEAAVRAHVPAIAAGMAGQDIAGVHAVLQAMVDGEDIVCIAVAELRQQRDYTWPDGGCGTGVGAGSGVGAGGGRAMARYFGVPVVQDGGQELGHLTVFYTNATARRQLDDHVVGAAWLLVLILSGTTIAAMLALRITVGRPLARFIASIHETERAGRRISVDWHSADQFGSVISAYNAMLERLEEDEAALRRSEERLSLAITATRSTVYDLDLRTGEFWWSAEFPVILGYQPGELEMAQRTWECLIHPEDLAAMIAAKLRHIAGDSAKVESVYRLRHRDESWRWVEDKATAIRDDRGVPTRLTGILADITERRATESELERERAILQATLENVDQGIVMFDANLKLVMFNRRVAEMLNVPLKLLTQHPTYAEIIKYQRERGEFTVESDSRYDAWKSNRKFARDYFAFKRRRSDGVVLEVRMNQLFQGGLVCTYTDVTQEAQAAEDMFLAMQETERTLAALKETQASLVQAEKMRSLGILVAGIAHEINTPVGIAFSCAGHLANRTQELTAAFEANALKRSVLAGYVHTAAESTRLMVGNLQRAAELIRGFKQVAVDQASAECRRFDLKKYLDEVILSLGPRLKASSLTVTVTCPEDIMVNSFPGALSQVLTNLAMNSLVHAFEGKPGEKITIAVTEQAGGELQLLFADNGKGIPAEYVDRIFDPFFTTKRGNGGSGLGLHIVYNLVTQTLGGRIAVDTEPGTGTRFTLLLPREAVAAPPTPDAPAGGKAAAAAEEEEEASEV